MARKKEEDAQPSFSDAMINAASSDAVRLRDNPGNALPNIAGWGQAKPEMRDIIMSALAGLGTSSQAATQAARLGDPVSAALAGIGGAFQAPSAQHFATQRAQLQQQQMEAQLAATPVDQISPAIVEKHPEFSGMPLGVVQKLAPFLNRQEAMEQQLAMFIAAEQGRNSRNTETANSAKERNAALKRLPAPQVLALTEGQSVSRLLPEVEQAIESNQGAFGPVSGRARGANPYDDKAQAIDARMRSASQAFGRFMERGVLRKEDEEKYRKMFPQLQDTPETAKNKLAIVRRQLAQEYAAQIQNMGGSGYDVSAFEVLDIPPSIFGGSEKSSVADSGEVRKKVRTAQGVRTGVWSKAGKFLRYE